MAVRRARWWTHCYLTRSSLCLGRVVSSRRNVRWLATFLLGELAGRLTRCLLLLLLLLARERGGTFVSSVRVVKGGLILRVVVNLLIAGLCFPLVVSRLPAWVVCRDSLPSEWSIPIVLFL